MSEAQPVIAAAPEAPRGPLSWRAFARAWRRNALGTFSQEAFEEEIVRRRFFGREQILMCRPAGIRHVLIDNPDNYARTAATIRLLSPIVGKGLLLAAGEEWRQRRRLLAPAFSPRTLPLLAEHVAAAADAAVAELAAAGEEPIDLLAAMQRLALEIAGRSMFSLEMDRFGAPLRQLLLGYALRLGRPTLFDLVLPRGIPTLHDLLRWRFRRRWTAFIAEIIGERAKRPAAEGPRDLFDLLEAACRTEGEVRLSPEIFADEVATLIVAGHETTALALFWAQSLLAAAPAVAERLADEASGMALDPAHVAENLPKLIYARAVVQEALRLYPPAFAVARQAIAADDAGGVAVRPGTVVLIAPWVLHRHKRLWPNPEAFDPERFLPGAPPPDRFAYLPFGLGPRSCIGAQFALTEATIVLARMAQAFRVEREGADPILPVAAVTLRPRGVNRFRLHPRRGAPARASAPLL